MKSKIDICNCHLPVRKSKQKTKHTNNMQHIIMLEFILETALAALQTRHKINRTANQYDEICLNCTRGHVTLINIIDLTMTTIQKINIIWTIPELSENTSSSTSSLESDDSSSELLVETTYSTSSSGTMKSTCDVSRFDGAAVVTDGVDLMVWTTTQRTEHKYYQ